MILTIFKREFQSYLATPLAYLFMVIFIILSGTSTFYIGSFFERGQADLGVFFYFLPWLYLLLVPALTMRLWAEERKSGTIELLLTLPVSPLTWVLSKFLAAWFLVGVALALSFPIWITVNYLGDPDNGAIVAGYLGSWFMAGAFIAVGSAFSASTQNQVIAFVLTLSSCLVLVAAGFPPVLDVFRGWASTAVLDLVSDMSIWQRFLSVSRGVIDLRDVLYFASIMVLGLFITTYLVRHTVRR